MSYDAFIVRIEWDRDGQPHGFVSDPKTGERLPFRTIAELLTHLHQPPHLQWEVNRKDGDCPRD